MKRDTAEKGLVLQGTKCAPLKLTFVRMKGGVQHYDYIEEADNMHKENRNVEYFVSLL